MGSDCALIGQKRAVTDLPLLGIQGKQLFRLLLVTDAEIVLEGGTGAVEGG